MLANLVIGLLPLVFIVGSSVMLNRIGASGAGSRGVNAWRPVLAAFGVAIGALAAQNTLSPLQAALGELITRRVDGHCIRRLMSTGLVDLPLPLLERQDVLDKLSMARRMLTERWQTPGSAVTGLIALVTRYVQILGAVLLAGLVLGPLAGVILGLTAAVIRVGSRCALSLWSRIIDGALGGPHRKMMYVLEAGSDPAAAKEIRVFGLLPWLGDRADKEIHTFHDPLWRERRRIYFAPFMGFTIFALAGSLAVLLPLRTAAASGSVSVLGLSLALQAILVPLRMGTFYPESDLQTMFGMLAQDTIRELETAFRREPPEVPRAVVPNKSRSPVSAIRFENVHFDYPGSERAVLRGLDLELPAGTSTALVGLNGAGKTTVVKLLARLYEPSAGRITVDGADLADFELADWQRRLAVIFQDYVRYQLDAATSIGLGAPGRQRAESALRAAAEWADANEIVASLPAGLATVLSASYRGGVDLSGGQWQRIALARALFAIGAGASVLVLDEPTAQLDVRAEVAFFDRFLSITSGLTTLIVSHRFSSVRRADRIVVLADGRVGEVGSHDELIRKGGRYAELFEIQARRFHADLDALADTGGTR